VHHRTGDYYALKKSTQAFRGTRDQAKFLREVRAMRTIASIVAQNNAEGHPNIVRYERAWQDSGYFYIVMELCCEVPPLPPSPPSLCLGS
jgi:serine/threonine protein kinase